MARISDGGNSVCADEDIVLVVFLEVVNREYGSMKPDRWTQLRCTVIGNSLEKQESWLALNAVKFGKRVEIMND
jgi:hypothetical protein